MILDQELEDFLEHHGVKGQKWGRRKSKYFSPTSKQERRQIRRSESAREGRKIIAKAVVSYGTGFATGVAVNKLVSKKHDRLVANLAGGLSAYAGAAFMAKALDLNGKRRMKSLARDRSRERK